MRQRNPGVTVIMVLLALALFIVALSGNASKVLSSLLKWLSGGKLIPFVTTTKKKTKKNDTGGTGGTTAPAPAPAPTKDQATKAATAAGALGAGGILSFKALQAILAGIESAPVIVP